MNIDKHTRDEDFPLSGGKEPNIKISPWVLVLFLLFILLVIAANLHNKGII
jgi:biopolymer transport protein ExbD